MNGLVLVRDMPVLDNFVSPDLSPRPGVFNNVFEVVRLAPTSASSQFANHNQGPGACGSRQCGRLFLECGARWS